ncbi:GNAT family N-acetyltransferase [Lysinibacillus agricola]|uniref:GNAT family N-acetyltransferase n=1 Tax=Lysinibacillus agricola TaxID=2590012 RepID=A0ABX7AVJ8_9BACI|nr:MULTISPECIES: GNAT family protein [Lysinibacillus]KOS62062.1 alanine acetyltransferase [Lysinibacillus sp. FJAT-14222]QQP13996.1 GNAT family N-acetyltransferase [Lysinibacillus agricola]
MQITINPELSLRTIALEDANAVFALTDASRVYLRKWLPWLDFTKEVADSTAYIEGCIKGHEAKSSLSLVIIFRNEIVGVAGFNAINHSNKIAAIGYWLGEGAQGHGIMTKTVQALLQYAFEELQLNKVEIRAAVGNSKSRAIPERLGFAKEGSIRAAEWLYDHYVDHAAYGMLASEWKQIKEK